MDFVIYYFTFLFLSILSFAILFIISRKDNSNSDKTGYDFARDVLDKNGYQSNYIVEVKGNYKDHYDFDKRVVRLSSNIYNGKSIYAYVISTFYAMYSVTTKKNKSYFKIISLFNKLMTFLGITSIILFIVGVSMSYELVQLAFVIMLFIYCYSLLSMYGVYLNIKEIKKLDDFEYNLLWFLYLIPLSAITLNVINMISDFLEDIKNRR